MASGSSSSPVRAVVAQVAAAAAPIIVAAAAAVAVGWRTDGMMARAAPTEPGGAMATAAQRSAVSAAPHVPVATPWTEVRRAMCAGHSRQLLVWAKKEDQPLEVSRGRMQQTAAHPTAGQRARAWVARSVGVASPTECFVARCLARHVRDL